MSALSQALSAIAGAMGLRDPGEPVTAAPDPDEPPLLLVKAKVRDVIRRGVPLNRLERGPVAHTARVVFADGSVAVVRSVPEGHLTAAAIACLRTRVVARPAASGSDGDLEFRWLGGQVLVQLMGPDQPD